MRRPFNVLKVARAEIGNLHAEPACLVDDMGLRRDKSPRLGDSLRGDGFVSEYPSPGSGAKPQPPPMTASTTFG
jgi:hypothetical protein